MYFYTTLHCLILGNYGLSFVVVVVVVVVEKVMSRKPKESTHDTLLMEQKLNC